MGIFGKLTHADELKKRQEQLKILIKEYEDLLKKAVEYAKILYQYRQKAYDDIAALQYYVHRLDNASNVIIKGIDRAIEFASVIKEARDNELDEYGGNMSVSNNFSAGTKDTFSKVSIGVAAAGGATAVGGSTALMAIATTFGTASTGTAISTLGGAAAVNAAMAWLGGGAIAAGGAGVAGGAAVLGALGPIGLSLAAIGITASVISATKNRAENDTKITEINNLIEEVKNCILKYNRIIKDIKSMIEVTINYINSINLSALSKDQNDFNLDTYPKMRLVKMIDDAKTLGKLTRESISIED